MIVMSMQKRKEPEAKPPIYDFGPTLGEGFGVHHGSAKQENFLTNPSIIYSQTKGWLSVGMRPELSNERGKHPLDKGTWRDVSATFKGTLTVRTEGMLPEEFERTGKKVVHLKTADFFDTLRLEGTLADPLLVFRNGRMYLTHNDSRCVYCVDFTGRAVIKDEDAGKVYSAASTVK